MVLSLHKEEETVLWYKMMQYLWFVGYREIIPEGIAQR